jgi:ketosteroid isomerase-like protein
MIYSYFAEKLARQSFANVQNRNYDEVLKALAPNVTHYFAGDHALGGTRHERESVRRWLNRLGTVLPNLRFDVKNVWVKGPPWRTTVIVQWVATATLANGDPYVNRGAHIITMQWGKVYSFYAYEDSQAVATGLAKQAQAGIKEAAAPKIES